MSLLFLISGLLLAVSVVSMVSAILAISSVNRIDFPVVLLLLHMPLATRLKKSSLSFRSLHTYIIDCEQIGHRSELLHDDLLHSLDIADSVMKALIISMP
jgi:cytochrome c oxidase assembly factor CtaG